MIHDRASVNDDGTGIPSGMIGPPPGAVCVPSRAIVGAPSGTVVWTPPGTHPGIPPDADSPVERCPVGTVWINVCAPPGIVPGITPGTEIYREGIDGTVELVQSCLVAFSVGVFCDKVEISFIILGKEFLLFLLFLFRHHCIDHSGTRIRGGTVVDVVAISC